MSTPFPVVTVRNQLSVPLVVYDSFDNNPGPAPSSPATIFGTLTPLATVPSGQSAPITPIHGPISTYLAYDTSGAPITREFTMGSAPKTFVIDAGDTARMAATEKFIVFITANPNDPLATQFNALLQGQHVASSVNAFFKRQPAYASCTFVTYMMAILARAQTTPQPQPPQNATYSLAQLCAFLGGTWPPGFPDVQVTNFTCSNDNDTFLVGGDVRTADLPFASAGAPFIRQMLPATVHATFSFHYGFDAGAFGTRIEFTLPSITLISGVTLNNPTITVDISPLFKFAVFTAKAVMPFSLFSNPPFNADLSVAIDNIEASIGVVIDGNNQSLLTPPVMKGVHFDQFGVGMGVIFEPPSDILGVQGKFHIGDGGNVVQLDDDTFVIVCKLEGEVPEPVYISFYVPKMDLGDVVTVFTNTSTNFGLPVTVTDLSFQWAENPMEPVVLPDGSLSSMGYGFSGNLNVLGFSLYGNVQIGANGIEGNVTSSPLSAGPLTIAGNGQGVSIKVDANGNPIRNNQLPTTQAMKNAIANATTKQLVPPGGPSLTISTSSSPYLSLGASVSLFDLVNESINAAVTSSGISFELDYGSVLETKMSCTLADFHNFSGTFQYGIDTSISLGSVAGFSLGSIPLEATCNATLGIDTSASDLVFKLGGGFDFEGLTRNIGPFDADIHIARITDAVSAITQYLLDHIEAIFGDILNDAKKWAGLVYSGIITGVDDVATGLKDAFGQSEEEVASIMAGAGRGIDEAASAIKNAFSASATDVAVALSTSYDVAASAIGGALNSAGYAIGDVANALANALGQAPAAINTILQGIGYSADQVENAFDSLGGDFASWAESIWGAFDPTHW